jgi:hypothetical protein
VLKIGALSVIAVMGAAGLYTAICNLRSRAQIAAQTTDAVREIVRDEIRGENRVAGHARREA